MFDVQDACLQPPQLFCLKQIQKGGLCTLAAWPAVFVLKGDRLVGYTGSFPASRRVSLDWWMRRNRTEAVRGGSTMCSTRSGNVNVIVASGSVALGECFCAQGVQET